MRVHTGVADMRAYWKAVCLNATATGFVDGCFSDSSENNTHGKLVVLDNSKGHFSSRSYDLE